MQHSHTFIKAEYEGYEVCTECGSYHSTGLLPADEVYVSKNYWDVGDGTTGRSTIEQQFDNLLCTDDCGISKVDRVLQFVPKRGKNVLEIAGSPGALMQKLVERNYEVYGIEPRLSYCEYLSRKVPEAKIVCGYFPEATKDCNPETFTCVLGLDIFEHIEDSKSFLDEVKRLLIPGGTAIFMSPIIDNQDGFLRKRDMCKEEHAWIYTQRFLEPYLKEMFSEIEFRGWIVGHSLIILKK